MAPIYLPTKELIALKKEDLWFLYDERDEVDYRINTCGFYNTRLKFKQENIRRDIIDAEDDLQELQCRYQEEQRQIETKKCLEVEAVKRQQAKKLREQARRIIVRWNEEQEELRKKAEEEQVKAQKEEKGQPNEQEEKQEKEIEVEPTFLTVGNSKVVFEMSITEESIVQEVEQVQTEKNSEIAFEVLVTEEKTVREMEPVQIEHVEFIIPENLLQPPLNTKLTLSTILFPNFFQPYRMKTSSSEFQRVLSMEKNSWIILSIYKTRGRVFSNKRRMMGNQVGNQVSGSLWKVDSFTLIMVVDNYWV